jgi:hypothetical protein
MYITVAFAVLRCPLAASGIVVSSRSPARLRG